MSRGLSTCICMLTLSAAFVGVGQAQAGDRYGPEAPPYADATSSATSLADERALQAPVRMLNWPGKVTSAQAPVTIPARADAQPTVLLSVRDSNPAVRSRPMIPPPRGSLATADRQLKYSEDAAIEAPLPAPSALNPHYGLVQAVAPAKITPALAGAPASAASIYDPPSGRGLGNAKAAPGPVAQVDSSIEKAAVGSDVQHPGWAPPRRAWSQASDTGVRFYSLHRQYGVKPDPAPIPPQFFTTTADVTDPAGPTPRTVAGAGTAAQAARALQASDSDASSSQP